MTDKHIHEEGCDCGCEDEMMDVLVLVDEEDQEHEFELIDELEVDGASYRILIPLDEEESDDDMEEQEVVILKVFTDENGEEFLSEIEDDDEWEKVADAWNEALSSEDFD